MRKKGHKAELLAPAGSRDGFLAAMQAGADAVYLGGEKFGARAYADNFSQEELIRTIREAHILGRRVYLTVNILMRESELPELLDYMRPVCAAGLDGVIVQDLGVLRLFSDAFPDLELHASTQLSVTAPESVRFLKRLGVCRVVPARELSLAEIEEIKREDIEVETFVHGAMCYSYSGRCLMSSFLGGRSGNRGRCAGPCRLPYTVLNEHKRPAGKDARVRECYPISMRDMCALELLPELLDAGIDSFKIEGRMKRPEYAAGVTAVYRKYMDRYEEWDRDGRRSPWTIDPEDMDLLKSLYLRSDLCRGYYHERNGRDMVTIRKPGYSGTDEALLETIRRMYPDRLPKTLVSGRIYLHAGEPSRLTVSAQDSFGGQTLSVTAEGPCVEEAQNRPLTEEEILKRLRKTGESPFEFDSLITDLSGSVFLPVGQLNALRRQALEELETRLADACHEPYRLEARRKRASLRISQSDSNADDTSGNRFTEEDNVFENRVSDRKIPDSIRPADDKRDTMPPVMALVSSRQQFQAAVSAGISRIILEYDTEFSQSQIEKCRENYCIYLALPYIFRTEEKGQIPERIRVLRDKCPSFRGVLARTLEELELVQELRKQTDPALEILADAGVYQWNRLSMDVIRPYSDRYVAPLELAGKEIRQLTGPEDRRRMIMPVYGKIPLMISAGCLRKTEGCCLRLRKKHRQKPPIHGTIRNSEPGRTGSDFSGRPENTQSECGFWYLKDRKNMMFPVRFVCSGCHNIIYNAEPLSLHRHLQDPVILHAGSLLLSFTDETGPETAAILQFYQRLLQTDTGRETAQPAARKNVRFPQQSCLSGDEGRPFESYTNGHYRRGAI